MVMTPKRIEEELRITDIKRRMELIGDYNSEDEDKILEQIEIDSSSIF